MTDIHSASAHSRNPILAYFSSFFFCLVKHQSSKHLRHAETKQVVAVCFRCIGMALSLVGDYGGSGSSSEESESEEEKEIEDQPKPAKPQVCRLL